MLISFESEVNNIRNQYGKDQYEVIVPKTNILAEFPVAWVDKTSNTMARRKRRKPILTTSTPQAQKIITGFYYRVNNPQLMAEQKDRFPQTALFNVNDAFGGWPQVMKTHFASGGELDKLLAAGRG